MSEPAADPRAVATALALALDADDFDAARPLLDPGCVYEIGETTLTGPDAILASYAGNSVWAKKVLDGLEYESRVVATEGDTATVEFLDRLRHRGEVHEHRCRQEFSVGREGRIVRIRHRDLPGEPEALRAFFGRVGIER
jgi:hypothetical protein